MTRKDFSNGFDTLVNSYRRFRSFDSQEPLDSIEFDEYEKSLFLTKAQEEIVEELYTGKTQDGESYEETERLRRSLAFLNEEKEFSPQSSSGYNPISSHSQFFNIGTNVLYITYEAVGVASGQDDCLTGKMIETIPVRQDWYHRQVDNPFRGISKKRALRLDKKNGIIEIVYPLTIGKYYVRYVRKPNPIILENLPNNLTVNGSGTQSDCELDSHLHYKILERGVILGLQSKGIGVRPRPSEKE